MKLINLFIVTAVAVIAFSCKTTENVQLPPDVINFKQPTVAVLTSDNKASFYKNWHLGEGFQEVLINELLKTKRYNVATRQDIDAVMAEIDLQGSDMMRKQGKVRYGQLHNVKYLIKGTVTDFAHISGGYLDVIGSKIGFGGDGSIAQVSVIISVIEVETGRIISSTSLSGTAKAYSLKMKGEYDNTTFGGSVFKRTPLGEATTEVIERCVQQVTKIIARNKWYPRVMKTTNRKVYITGGKARGMQLGANYRGIKHGEPLVDPETGDVLGYEKPIYFGKIKVTKLHPKYAEGVIIEGNFNHNDELTKIIEQGQQK